MGESCDLETTIFFCKKKKKKKKKASFLFYGEFLHALIALSFWRNVAVFLMGLDAIVSMHAANV